MPDTTTRRRQNAQRKADWLLANPDIYQWLLSRGPGPARSWRHEPTAKLMAGALRAANIYSQNTTVGDVCYAMKRAAIKLSEAKEVAAAAAVRDNTATTVAIADLLEILARPGVHLPSIRKTLRLYKK